MAQTNLRGVANGGAQEDYRRQLAIDHTKVVNSDLVDFPVLVHLQDPQLRPTALGGQIGDKGDGDFFFTDLSGQQRLPHELVDYAPEKGQLRAWVRVPVLSCREGTMLYLCWGNGAEGASGEGVWDATYALVGHGDQGGECEGVGGAEELTVEAWVYGAGAGAEKMQSLVSQWAPSVDFDRFSAFDAGTVDGLDCVGYYGAVFDGRYVYWCPIRSHRSRDTVHAHVLRYDTHGEFSAKESWAAYDAGATDGLNTVCYYGAVFDGRYVIFVPRDDGDGYHSRVLRYDSHGDFKSEASWQAFDVGLSHSHQGAAFDGRYAYFCPGYASKEGEPLDEATLSGKVLRMDTAADFKDRASYQVFDTEQLSPDAVCFDGGAFDGRYIYLVPLCRSLVVRYDTTRDFSDPASWQSRDAKPFNMQMNVGAIFDGRYLYFVSYGASTMVRYDTRADFVDEDSWEVYQAAGTSGLDTGGFDGGFFDGRYVYFVPWTRAVAPGEEKSVYHCNFLRYDTSGAFDDPASWQGHDAAYTDGIKTVGYNAGAFDGRYFYTAPLCDEVGDKFHGKVLRYDSLGDGGGTFSLRYCDYGHNGGLCAAVLGPSFVVNTTKGPLGVAAHKALTPGWHHLAGVYNGRTIKLFIDGVLVAERVGSGGIQPSNTAVSIGGFSEGAAGFDGTVAEVRIVSRAHSDDWIKTAYQNLVNPTGFVRIGPQD